MRRSRILLATRSTGKLRELRQLFERSGVVVLDLATAGIDERAEEDSIEQFETFEENATAKAQYFFERSDGIPAVADDSGLEVGALGGEPGVRSRRWSERSDLDGAALDAANNRALLDALASRPDRAARYVCVAALADGEGSRTFRGECAGRVLHSPRGDDGFGYDPLFESRELGLTFAECRPADKERVSHRGQAIRALISWLAETG